MPVFQHPAQMKQKVKTVGQRIVAENLAIVGVGQQDIIFINQSHMDNVHHLKREGVNAAIISGDSHNAGIGRCPDKSVGIFANGSGSPHGNAEPVIHVIELHIA
jgi:hypothetical protein